MQTSYRRPERAFAFGIVSAYGTIVLFCVSVLPDPAAAGKAGKWIAGGLGVVLGHAVWLIPAWFADAALRAWNGAPRDPRRMATWAFHVVAASTTCDLFLARGGWIGAECGSVLWTVIGFGAYLIAIGVWVVAGMRMLGPRRVEQVVAHAATLAHRALAGRQQLLLPMRTLQAEVVAMPPAAAVLVQQQPPPAPAAEPASYRAAPAARAVTPARRDPSRWRLPDPEMLPPPMLRHVNPDYLARVARDITLRLTTFGLRAQVVPAGEQGALVHRFELTPGQGQKLQQIKARQDDFNSAFAGLRFVDMPGTGRLGIEVPVPAEQRGLIQMREVIDSAAWTETRAKLPIAIGVLTSGEPVVFDLVECPHLLVAGTSGSGKSVGLNLMLASLLLRFTPSELQLVLIDPKLVEFAEYRDLPHLRAPIANTQAEALDLLRELVDEMEERYRKILGGRTKNIDQFNALGGERLPRIVAVVEEYADLTSRNGKEVEELVCRLAQKARAAGIDLILATQRPSVEIIHGDIKANFNGRIAYKVAADHDSKVVIGKPGAEKLMGKGDMLCTIPGVGDGLVRIHGAYIEETMLICDWWREQASSSPSPHRPPPLTKRAPSKMPVDDACITVDESSVELVAEPPEPAPSKPTSTQQPTDIYDRAVAYARERGNISARALVVMLRVGKNRADQLVDRMREAGHLRPGGPNNSYLFVETTTT